MLVLPNFDDNDRQCGYGTPTPSPSPSPPLAATPILQSYTESMKGVLTEGREDTNVYVVGHKNPDTDTICSAIGYAYMRNTIGGLPGKAVPVYAGRINEETLYALKRFKVPAPERVSDLHPRVRDIMLEAEVVAGPDTTLREIGALFHKNNWGGIPVVDNSDGGGGGGGRKLLGLVTRGSLSNRYVEELELQDLSEDHITLESLVRTIDGAVVWAQAPELLAATVQGRARILVGSKIPEGAVRKGDVVIVGDDDNVNAQAIDLGAACLIFTSGMGPSQDLVCAAAEMCAPVVMVATPNDAFKAARLIGQSVPAKAVMATSVITFAPDTLVSEARAVAVRTGLITYPVIQGGQLLGVVCNKQLINPKPKNVILVDHNESSQSIEGVGSAHILEIIDHHRLGGLQTSEPIFIRHEPVGATATIVTNMGWHRKLEFPPEVAGLLLSAIISDTLLFKSPTCTKKDIITAERLAKIAGVDLSRYGKELLRAGVAFDRMSAAEIVRNDMKLFDIGGFAVTISQVMVVDMASVHLRMAEIVAEASCIQERSGHDATIILITNIISETTYLVHVGALASVLVQAFKEPSSNPNVWELPNVLSRKSQVVPPLCDATKKMSF